MAKVLREELRVPPPLSPGEEKELFLNIKQEINNLIIRERFIKPKVSNYDPWATYVIYDNKEIFLFDRNLHEARLASGQYASYYISRPDRHT